MTSKARLSLVECFKEIREPRVVRRCDHELVDILVIALSSVLCGGESFNDMEDFGKAKEEWFRSFLSLRHGIPSHDTFNRVFAALKPETFLECFLKWTQGVRQTLSQEIVAVDGKALRQAVEQGQSPRYVVSAWAHDNQLVLGQLKVADKSNEITAVPELLRALDLAGCLVTLDAMGCQKKIVREIIEADAQYTVGLKGNQETVLQEVKSFLDDALKEDLAPAPRGGPKTSRRLASVETVEKDHGRLEIRRYYQSADLEWFADLKEWEGLRSVGMVESIRQVGDAAPTTEWRYYLSSLPVDVERFARSVRGHWGVENSLHWVLDVQMGEDRSRARAGHAPENLATLRRLALNLLKQEKTKKRGVRGKQLNAGWNHAYLLRLLGF